MRFGVTPHPGFKSRSLRSDLRFAFRPSAGRGQVTPILSEALALANNGHSSDAELRAGITDWDSFFRTL